MKTNWLLIQGMIWFVVAVCGTNYGWLPNHWAIIMALIGAINIDKYAIRILRSKKDEST